MVIYHCLVEVTPYDPAGGSRPTIRLASANLRTITGLGGQTWEPALIEPPKTSLSLFGGDFSDAVRPGAARLPISLARVRKSHPFVDGAYWPGAQVKIYVGRVGDAWPWATHFSGRVKTFERDREVLALGCEVDEEPFLANVLPNTYEGTGLAEGGIDLTGRPKPLVLGHAMNVEPTLIDAVNSVYQFSGYGPIQGVDALFERAANFGPALGNYATYAALVAADIPAGRWATCLAQGMIRLGAPAYGVITGDIRGHVISGATPRRPGAIIRALASIAGVNAAALDTATLNAMDAVAAALPSGGNTGIVVDQQARFLDLARRIALPFNHQAGISLTGKLFAIRVDIDGSGSLILHTQGRAAPQVTDAKELAVSPPYSKTMLGANRAWRVHSADEIAFDAPLIPRGLYDPSETYRLGNIVTLADKSQWLYVADDPSSGNAPPAWPTTSNTWWANLEPPVSAADIKYEDGTPIEDLKPAEPDATHGAPPGTPVGDRPAEQVISELDQLEQDIADADSAIAAAESHITELLGDMAAAELAILGAQGDIANVQSTVATLGSTVSTNTTAISNIEGNYANLTTIVAAGGGAINKSANFADNQNVSGPPTNWDYDPNIGPNSAVVRDVGENGVGRSVVLYAYPGEPCYFAQQMPGGLLAPLNWYVVELEFYFYGGSLQGMGVYLANSGASIPLHVPTDFVDATGNAPVPEATRTYRLTRLIQLPASYNPGTPAWLYAMGHWSGFGSIDAINHSRLYKTAIRRATKAEIDAGVALPALQATVATQATAISALDSSYAALSSSLATLGATVASNATAISDLTTNYAGLSTRLEAQAAVALIRNPRFSMWPTGEASPTGWRSSGAVTWERTTGANGLGNAVLYNAAPGQFSMIEAFGGSNAGLGAIRAGYYVVEIDLRLNNGWLGHLQYYLQGTNAERNTELQVITETFDAIPDETGVPPGAGVVGKEYQFRRLVHITNPDVRSANLLIGTFGGDVHQGKHITLRYADVRPATPQEIRDQTVLAPLQATVTTQATALSTLESQYASLNSTVSTQGVTITSHANALTTQSGQITTLFGRAGVRVDVNGRVTGWETNNNGTVGNFIIHADHFAIEKPGGGPSTTFANGVWRVDTGSVMLAYGTPFGSSNQFIQWYGPTQTSLANCTEGNALFYLKADGTAYFGGVTRGEAAQYKKIVGSPPSTSFSQIGPTLMVFTGSGTVDIGWDGTARPWGGTGNQTYELKWQVSADQSSWSDVGAAASGGVIAESPFFPASPAPPLNRQATGLPAASVRYFRIVARRVSSNAEFLTLDGSGWAQAQGT